MRERFPTPFPFSISHPEDCDRNNVRVREAKVDFFFPGHPIPTSLLSPPLAPEFRTVNTCLNFVPKHTCVSVCLPNPDISFVAGICLSVQIRSKVEIALVRGSQRQKKTPVVADCALQTGPQALMGFQVLQ